jgi:hypothetical protein
MHIIRFTQFFQIRINKTLPFLFLTNANLHTHFQTRIAVGGLHAMPTCPDATDQGFHFSDTARKLKATRS